MTTEFQYFALHVVISLPSQAVAM